MPTGYTSGIYNGNTSLRDYILACSRGMGFLMSMRDSASDAEIPKRIEPSDYHQKAVDEANRRLVHLNLLTDEQIEAEAQREYDDAIDRRREALATNDRLRVDYEEMIRRVRKWECPSKLDGLKKLMLDQAHSALDFDVQDMTSPDSYYKPPVRLSPSRWMAEAQAQAAKDVAYHTEEWEKELVRNEERNEYLSALWECLPDD